MKRYLAILRDTFRETLDYKMFYILVAFSLIIILVFLTFKFESKPTQEVMEKIITDAFKGRVENFHETAKRGLSARISFDISADDPSLYFMRVADWKQNKIVWGKRQRRYEMYSLSPHYGITYTGTGLATVVEMTDPKGSFRLDKDNIDAELTDFLYDVLGQAGMTKPEIHPHTNSAKGTIGVGVKRFAVSGQVDFTHLAKSCKVHIFFGARTIELPTSLAEFTLGFQIALVNFIAGWIGILISLIVTAGFVPNMLQKGTIELWLSKPLRRWGLLTYKYIGGLTFIFLNALILVGGTFLVLSFKTGFWNYWYLMSIFVLVFAFAVLYAVSVFFGVLLRNAVVCILMSLLTWFISFIIYTAKVGINSFGGSMQIPAVVKTSVNIAHFVLPKTSEIKAVNNYILTKMAGVPQEMIGEGVQITGGDILTVILTSLGFIIITMFFASWIFSRKDY